VTAPEDDLATLIMRSFVQQYREQLEAGFDRMLGDLDNWEPTGWSPTPPPRVDKLARAARLAYAERVRHIRPVSPVGGYLPDWVWALDCPAWYRNRRRPSSRGGS
jgi:hypothetical protein